MPTLSCFGCVAGAFAGFAVEVDEGAEAVGFAADDGDHERKTEGSRACEGLRRAAYSQPDREEDFAAGGGRRPGR